MRATDAVGDYGERVAQRFLTEQGMTVLCRGWRCGQGEIDLVAVDGDCLVVCEVKTRRSVLAGTPLDAVTPAKLFRLRKLAAAWLAEHGGGYPEVRIDVVAVLVPRRGGPRVEHVRGLV
jgi:putative endonuclease